MTGKFRDFLALIFTVGHFADEEQLQVFGFHGGRTVANTWKIPQAA
jgi:hypothetical protein